MVNSDLRDAFTIGVLSGALFMGIGGYLLSNHEPAPKRIPMQSDLDVLYEQMYGEENSVHSGLKDLMAQLDSLCLSVAEAKGMDPKEVCYED